MNHETFCLSCFSGEYPVFLEGDFSKTCFEEDLCAPGPRKASRWFASGSDLIRRGGWPFRVHYDEA